MRRTEKHMCLGKIIFLVAGMNTSCINLRSSTMRWSKMRWLMDEDEPPSLTCSCVCIRLSKRSSGWTLTSSQRTYHLLRTVPCYTIIHNKLKQKKWRKPGRAVRVPRWRDDVWLDFRRKKVQGSDLNVSAEDVGRRDHARRIFEAAAELFFSKFR